MEKDLPPPLRELIFSYLKPLPFLEEISKPSIGFPFVDKKQQKRIYTRKGRDISYSFEKEISDMWDESFRTCSSVIITEMYKSKLLGCVTSSIFGIRENFCAFGAKLSCYLPIDFNKKEGEWIFRTILEQELLLLLP